MSQTLEERVVALEKQNLEINRELSSLKGQFEYISSQLRQVQLYMHARFERADKEIKDLRAEMNGRFGNVDARFAAMDRRFDAMDRRFDAMDQRFDEIPSIVRDVMREVLAEQRKH